jgi:long-chain acyl-CoA synthetase
MRSYRWYPCQPVSDLRELVEKCAEKYGGRDAFRFRGEGGTVCTISYTRLLDDVRALGTALLSMGLKGVHLAVIGENSYEWVVTYLAVVNGGGVIVPIDRDLPDDEIAGIIRRSDSGAIACSNTLIPVIEAVSPSLPGLRLRIGMQGAGGGGFISFQGLIEKGRQLLAAGDRSFADAAIDQDAMCIILYTSGTTGSSKAVMLSHRNITTCVNGALRAVRVKGVTMSVLPIHHTYECSCSIFTGLYAGVTICFNDSLKYLSSNLSLFKPNMIVLVPLIVETFYKKLMDEIRKSGKQERLNQLIAVSNRLLRLRIDLRWLFFKSIRKAFGGKLSLIVCGGAPLRADLVARYRELGIQVLNGYGITECSPFVSVNRNRYHSDTSVGVVIPGCSVMIDSPDENGEGEILVRGDNVMLGYYNDESATAKAFTDGWFKTGDLGRLCGDGFLQITGRRKNTIILSNGKNVQPEEIEEYLLTWIPYIKDVVVFAAYRSGAGECIAAIVVPEREYIEKYGIIGLEKMLGADIASANHRLPSFKQIGNVRIQMVDFEKTSTKKIKRYKIIGGEMNYAGES